MASRLSASDGLRLANVVIHLRDECDVAGAVVVWCLQTGTSRGPCGSGASRRASTCGSCLPIDVLREVQRVLCAT